MISVTRWIFNDETLINNIIVMDCSFFIRILNFTTFKVHSVNDSSFRICCPYRVCTLHLKSNTWSPRQIHPLLGPPRQTLHVLSSYRLTNGSISARGTQYCLARVEGSGTSKAFFDIQEMNHYEIMRSK